MPPQKRYFGSHTEKAIKNFPFSFRKTPREFIYAITAIKRASAIAHYKAGELDRTRKDAIVKAAEEILAGKLNDQFFLPAFQGGAGTSNHMNVNEVIANRAMEILAKKGSKISVHPNDHVNMSASTNDVMPSALRMTAVQLGTRLLKTIAGLAGELDKKSREFKKIQKLGRTHLQDAVPVTLGGEFAAYAANVLRGQERIRQAMEFLLELNLGGTAVGNSINASPAYIKNLYEELRAFTKFPFRPAPNFMTHNSSNADFVSFSQSLTALCLDLSKIANDLRLLSSGPNGGLGEIILPELQPGSSIMPGKVNPVLPEAVNQLYFLVSGNNLTIEHAAHAAQLELGAMQPVMVDRLIESLKLMDELLAQFAKKCVAGIKADRARCREHLEKSTAYGALLSPRLGYDKVSELVKEAVKTKRTLREVVIRKKLLTQQEFAKLVKNFISPS
jgi:aspartate ammonia-lyase